MPKSPAERKAAQRARQSAAGERKLWHQTVNGGIGLSQGDERRV